MAFGDTLVDLENGLSSLLDLPVELALPTLDLPADRAAFARALS